MQTFNWSVRVYYEDTDIGGVVYHANYLKFFERARTEMLRSVGFQLNQLQTVDGVILVVRSLTVDYLQPAYFNDVLDVDTTLTLVKKASFNFEQTLRRDNELVCVCHNRIACLNAQTLRPQAIPAPLFRALANE